MKKNKKIIPYGRQLIDKKDMNQIRIVETMEDVVPILKNEIHSFYKK